MFANYGNIQALLSAPNPDDPLAENMAKHWKSDEAEAVATASFYLPRASVVSWAWEQPENGHEFMQLQINEVPNSASGNWVLISVILEVMMIALKDDGCQQEHAILHKGRGAVAEAANIDMLYDGYFRGLFPAENGRSNEASTSQTNEVRWFPAGGEFG
ncbi:unnamed protein product [Sphagnum troendelagicum]|uniref:Uncharacterized protein n=1 Tax=Sphagnum jensenii TaxID=128206 RepID=A0ABP0W9E1_9BRYO